MPSQIKVTLMKQTYCKKEVLVQVLNKIKEETAFLK